MGESEVQKEEKQFYSYKDFNPEIYQVTLIEKNRPCWCKIIWVIIGLGFFGAAGYLVYNLMTSYFQYSSYDKISTTFTNKETLPAITICSKSPYNYTKLKEYLDVEETQLLEDLMYEMNIYNGTGDVGSTGNFFDDVSSVKSIIAYLDSLGDYTGDNYLKYILEEVAFFPEELVVGFYYDYKMGRTWKFLNMSMAETTKNNITPHMLGYCITVNDDESLVQVVPGVPGGFTIMLDAYVDHYMPNVAEKGFEVYLRTPYEEVMVNRGGIIAEAGKETNIMISKNKMKRLGSHWGTCESLPSPYYPNKTNIYRSQRECYQEGIIEISEMACSCIPWYYVERVNDELGLNMTWQNATSCTFASQIVCDTVIYQLIEEFRKDNFSQCQNERCSYNSWDYTLQAFEFPSTEDYYNLIVAPVLKNEMYSMDYARKNLAKINIYYGDLKETAVVQEKAYEVFSFIAEFGGGVDFFIGISFFTAFQALEIAIAYTCCRRLRRRRTTPEENSTISNINAKTDQITAF